MFTLFIVPVFYSLLAAEHKPVLVTGEMEVPSWSGAHGAPSPEPA
jgi:hypothetical protein